MNHHVDKITLRMNRDVFWGLVLCHRLGHGRGNREASPIYAEVTSV